MTKQQKHLVFSDFVDMEEARMIARLIEKKWDWKTIVVGSQEESNRYALYEDELEPPLIVVERHLFDDGETVDDDVETMMIDLVEAVGGYYPGWIEEESQL